MKKNVMKVLSLAIVLSMLLAMGSIVAFAEPATKKSLGEYPYPYPLEGNRLEYCGWNEVPNRPNSVWYNNATSTAAKPNFYPLTEATDGYYEGWSTSNRVTTGKHHPYGVGMHSALLYAPSTVYNIDSFKITSFETTVFLVQYDMSGDGGIMDATPASYEIKPIVVYLDVSADGKTWGTYDESTGNTEYLVEETLDFKGDSVTLSLDAADLQGMSYIRMGIKTKHGYQDYNPDTGYFETMADSALASVYFADLYITQSEEVPAIQPPSIPERPTTSAAQSNAYESIDTWYSSPNGAWKAGSNPRYLLSNLDYLSSSNTPNNDYSSGQPTTVNHPYSAPGTTFLIGDEYYGYEYTNGIGMHPKNPTQKVFNRQDSWTVYDISAFTADGSETPADTFYALVGLTSRSNAWGSKYECQGVYAYIYGDKVGDGEHYELLAASELIYGDDAGEFNVNIAGVKLLLIDVILTESAQTHSYSAIGFVNASLFTADPNAQKPSQSETHQHSYSDWEAVSEYEHAKYCACGRDTIYEYHTWDEGTIVIQPSTGISAIVYMCTKCEATIAEPYNPHQHSYGSWQQYSSTQHIKVCSCGENPIYEGHTWDNGVVVSEATCTRAEQRQYTCTGCGYQKTSSVGSTKHIQGNDWQQHNDKQHKKTCSCGTNTTYTNHTFDNGVITTAPTCTKDGVKTYTCTGCGYQQIDTLPKTGHTWMEWIVDSDKQHRHRCACGETEIFDHIYDNDQDLFCNDCGYQRTPATSEPVKDEKDIKSLLGCDSTVTLGAGLTLLFSIGSAGMLFRKKKD